MKMIIAAEYEDITNVREMFSNLLPIKGRLPKIKSCHDDINKCKYNYDKKTKSGGISNKYPKNTREIIKNEFISNDIIIIPLDNALIDMITKSDKFKNIFIFEKDADNFNPDPDIEDNEYDDSIYLEEELYHVKEEI